LVNASTILKHNSLAQESYVKKYARDNDFKDVYEAVTHGRQNEESNYHVHDNLLYHLVKHCIPRDERENLMREAHTSLISSHFGVGKTIAQLQRDCYWPQMNEKFSEYIKGCVMCSTRNPRNRKLGLYTPLPVPSQPWESVSMDFVGVFSMSRKVHDYLYVIVERFNKMFILIPCKKHVTTKQKTHFFFANVWVHFLFPRSIISY
jgi:hypothetical protein